MQLSGQEYVDMYASKAKALDKETARKAAAEARAKAADDGTPGDPGSPELKAS
jgi:1-acyl-sn-glycerol-3-phosphate acyltransferase